ncbi:secretory immunoglobulin A-binding protein EsiB [Verrucomicrobiota bacterium]|nr:secretory immunoglobulin A-binding protein EsiB [Verrucomicrobiota bacterium]
MRYLVRSFLLLLSAWVCAGLTPAEVVHFEKCRLRAEAGDAEGQSMLGFCYFVGQGVEKDYEKAFLWLRRAAVKDSDAQMILAHAYRNGEGVPQDHAAAVSWYRKAVELGNPRAMVNLGSCYQRGEGVRADSGEAVALWRRAAEMGEARVQYFLGEAYAQGIAPGGMNKPWSGIARLPSRAKPPRRRSSACAFYRQGCRQGPASRLRLVA